MINKKPIIIYKVARMLTPDEMKTNRKIEEARIYLGIYWELDSKTETKEDNSMLPSVYSSMQEYRADKEYAEDCIYNNKKIPESIVKKLVTARKELEARGVLK